MSATPVPLRRSRAARYRSLVGLACCVLLSNCAPTYERVAPSIAVLGGYPVCAYEKLGTVSASDGQRREEISNNQQGGGTLETWGETASQESILAKLRSKAEALGANAVVIRHRMASGGAGRSSTMKRPEQSLKIIAAAIRTSSPPMLEPCNAVAWSG